jgi:hypothetical protein
MKKLMLTTALASLITTGAIAQTTITGELRVSYKSLSMDKGSANIGASGAANTTENTSYGFGAEQQINIQTKGKLNLGGLDYAAGFSIENDGEQQTTLFNENTYMDLINASSGTTISLGRDHIQRSDSDFSATNLVGFNQAELSSKGSSTNASNTYGGTHFLSSIGAAPSQNFGAAILQKTPFGTFSYNYVPTNGTAAPATFASTTVTGTNGTSSLANSEYVNENTTGAYEAGFVGDLGVKGLTAHYFQNKNSDFVTTNTTVKAEGKNYGIKYNVGQFTVAANKKIHQAESTDQSLTAGIGELTEKAYAVAYAVNKDLSVGLLYATAERDATPASATGVLGFGGKQKLKAINIGYNLGPVALSAAYAKNQDAQGVDGADDSQYMIRLIGAF